MTQFTQLGLSPDLLQAVSDAGYDTATPIQEQAIPVALAGRDVLGIAQTGTGKTAAFTLPMIERLASGRARARMPRSLVLAPTRELADQVAAAFEKYAKRHRLSWALLIGGVSMGDQIAKLDKGVDVLIATPGRLLDLFERGKILLTGVQILVVDEADRMLDMGFIPDIERIFKMTPAAKQTLFFSATMPPEITRLTTQFLKDPTRIEVARPATTADTISQYMVRLKTSEAGTKRDALRALIRKADPASALVFCNRKTDVAIVAKSLKKHGFDAGEIHGDLDQSTRMRTLEAFRSGALKLLVASDVAARGLDIPAVSHVFNYDVPYHPDDYVHRIGRTGRAGRTGEAFMIVTPSDDKALDKLLKLIGKTPEEATVELEGRRERGRDDRPAAEDRPRSRRPRRSEAEEAAPGVVEADALPPARARRERAERAPEPVAQTDMPAPAPRGAYGRRDREVEDDQRRAAGRVRSVPERDADDRRVVGFGSDTPAFLMRSVAPAPPSEPAPRRAGRAKRPVEADAAA